MPDKIKLRKFDSVCVVNKEGRDDNLASVIRRGLPCVQQLPERKEPLAIVCSGPSVPDYLDELRNWPGQLWAINGGYHYLLNNGIVADGFFGLDPLPGLAEYVEPSDPKTTFYIATICDPAVFDALEGRNIVTWNASGEDMKYPDKQWTIGGGSTAATRAPYLALLQGYRDITLYGVDSSFKNGSEYCYRHGTYACDIANIKLLVCANGEGPFETELGLMKQASQLNMMQKRFSSKLNIRCGGLMEAFLRAPEVSEDMFEIDNSPEDDLVCA